MVQQETFHLSEAAKLIGVAPVTLKRWFINRKIPDVGKDSKGRRIFTQQDLERIKGYASKINLPSEKQLLFDAMVLEKGNANSSSFRDSAFNGNKTLPFHRWVPWIAGFSADFVEDCFGK